MLDFIVLIIIALFILIGVLRGFLKEVFGLAGFIVAILITVYNYNILIKIFNIEHNLLVFNIISTVCVFLISMLLMTLLKTWILYALSPIRLGFLDRFLGFFTGALKGMIIAYLLLVIINMYYYAIYYDNYKRYAETDYYLPMWMKGAISYSYFYLPLEAKLNYWIPHKTYIRLQENLANASNRLRNEGAKGRKV